MNEMKLEMPKKLYPSAIFDTDEKYLRFLDNIIRQTYVLSLNENASFYVAAHDMMKKKQLHDFFVETKRRFLINKRKKKS